MTGQSEPLQHSKVGWNVINNYVVVPGVAVPDCAPLLVEDQVLFTSGSARLRDGFEPLLGLSVKLMELNPEVEITIVAHTDWIGTEAFNQRLSDARTGAIYDWIINQGADPDRLTQIGKGEAEPVASNQTEAGRAQNRRAEFQVRGLLAG